MVGVHPARWCTSPLGVVPAGLGDGVGDCHDAAHLPRVCLFTSLVFHYFFGRGNFTFFAGKVSCISLPLGMLVAKREPTPCYRDAYLVGTPYGAFWEKGWLKHCETMVSPLLGTLLFGKQKNNFLIWEEVLYIG